MIDPPQPDGGEAGQSQPVTWREGDMPYSEEFGDFYYSRADGRAECRHVFLSGNSLPGRFADRQDFTIAELGFGTGLNFLETWSAWEAEASKGSRLEFHSFELRPLPAGDMRRALSVWPDLEAKTAQLIRQWPEAPEGDIHLGFETGPGRIELTIHTGLAIDCIGHAEFAADAWYLDGFAPARNPDMWSLDLMQAVAARTAPNGTFATYSAAGWVRRNLQSAGFSVRKLKGHAGKRDMSAGSLNGPEINPG